MTRRTLTALLGAAVVAVVAVGAAVRWSRRGGAMVPREGPSSPVVLENGKTHYGKTYPEWANAWWRWLYETPQHGERCILVDADITGEDCAYGQTDPHVFFLAGTRGAKVVRTKCVVPKGRAIFLPILNAIQDNAGEPPDEALTEAQMRSAVGGLMNHYAAMSLKVDGVEVDLAKQRVEAVKFSYTLPPEPNYYSCVGKPGVTGMVGVAYQAGYFAMLAPLPPGPHEIAFNGIIQKTVVGDFVVDVVYHLRVE
jgi:hypothetical protein